MDFIDKVEIYLNKNGIEMDDIDKFTPNGRFMWDGENITRWEFNIPKPEADDLRPSPDDQKNNEDKKDLKAKIKGLRENQITILNKRVFDLMKSRGLFKTGDLFIYSAKLYIVTNDSPLTSFPNQI